MFLSEWREFPSALCMCSVYYRGADKSLARPGRKQVNVLILCFRASQYKSNENTNFMQHCAGFISAGSLYMFRPDDGRLRPKHVE